MITNEVKITKKEYFENIIRYLDGAETDLSPEQMSEFCQKELGLLVNRADKARERAAARRAEGDALQDIVYSVLTDDPATRQEIFDAVVATGNAGDDVSIAKVGYRLTALVAAEKAVKTEVTAVGADGKNHRYAAYSIA